MVVSCPNTDCYAHQVPDGEFETTKPDFLTLEKAIKAWNQRAEKE